MRTSWYKTGLPQVEKESESEEEIGDSQEPIYQLSISYGLKKKLHVHGNYIIVFIRYEILSNKNSPPEESNSTTRRSIETRADHIQRCLPNTTRSEELWVWPHSLISVAFFSKTKPKGGFLFLKMSPTTSLEV